jgi:hypothetical protein
MDALERNAPVILSCGLGASLLIFLFAQVRAVSADQMLLQAQLNQVSKRYSEAKAAVEQVDVTIEKSEQEARKAQETETAFAAFLADLLELSNIDPDARSIALKWKIQHSGTDKPLVKDSPPPVSPPEKPKPSRR